MENVYIMEHPLIQHKISLLRDKSTGTNEFRKLIEEIAVLMGFEALRDLPPVSYTHLDVYKRQGVGMRLEHAPDLFRRIICSSMKSCLNFCGLMSIVINYGQSADLAFILKTPVCACKAVQPLCDYFPGKI